MTTDRIHAARPAAPTTDRSAPAERSDGSPFAALLDAHATPARGSEPHGRRDDVRERRPDAHGHDRPAAGRDNGDASVRPQDGAPAPAAVEAKPELPAAPVPVIAAFIAAVPLEAVPAAPVAAAPAAPVVPVAPAAPTFETAPELPVAPVAAAPASPAAPTQAAPAQPQAPAAAPAPEAPVAESALPSQAAPLPAETPVPAELPATPQEAPAHEPAATTVTPEPEAAAPEAHAPAAAPARAATAEPASAPVAAQPAAQATEPATPAPLSTPLSGAVAPERAAPLHRAAAAVATLLHVAADRGITRAQLALKPAELGGVEIRLQASAAGISAQVIADSPEAAKLLAQAGDELRRSLESRDVTLISLEVSTTGEWKQQQESARGEWSDDDAGFTGAGSGRGDAEGDAEPTPTSHSVIELPGGLLVDVLA